MKTFSIKAISILILVICFQAVQAQKFGDMLKRASKKIERGVSDVLEERITDRIANEIIRKFDSQLDSIFQEAHEADSLSTGSSRSYGEYLSSMDESDKVSDSYKFDFSIKMKNTDHKGRVTYSTQYFSKDGMIFGVQNENMLAILDATNHIMVTYNTDDKTAFAFGEKLFKYSRDMVPDDMIPFFDLKPATGSKRILGYTCDKFTSESSDGKYELYVAQDFPYSMENAYKAVAIIFDEPHLEESFRNINGLVLENKVVEENGDVTTGIVTAVDESPFIVKRSEYKFGSR